MKLLIFIVVGVIAGIVLLAGVVALIGSRLPKSHVASRSILLRRSPHDVYAVARDFEIKRLPFAGAFHFNSDGRAALAADVGHERQLLQPQQTFLQNGRRLPTWTQHVAGGELVERCQDGGAAQRVGAPGV